MVAIKEAINYRGGIQGDANVNPNRDSPNGYPTVKHAELQLVTLSH